MAQLTPGRKWRTPVKERAHGVHMLIKEGFTYVFTIDANLQHDSTPV